MTKSIREKKITAAPSGTEDSSKAAKSAPKSKKKEEEDDDFDQDDELPAKKSGRSSDDDDDADVDVEDDWEKAEDDDSWDPDFQEFDIPKSKSSKSGGKKAALEQSKFQIFTHLFKTVITKLSEITEFSWRK
mgnify:CR=1 FL=1